MYESLLRRLTSAGWRRGRAGSRAWMIVATVAGGLRVLRYVTREREEVVYRTRVVPGDRFELITRKPAKR